MVIKTYTTFVFTILYFNVPQLRLKRFPSQGKEIAGVAIGATLMVNVIIAG